MSKVATVFGGSGFVGRYIVQSLAKSSWRVRVAVRHPNEAHFVRPYGVPGQVEPILANIRNEQSVAELVQGADAVINCVGILVETGKQKFDAIHHESAARIARLATEAGTRSLVHVSSIGADETSPSQYALTKGLGETAVNEAFTDPVILRPSIIFGTEDQFFNRFASMARFSAVIPTVSGKSLFQPVYVGNVAAAAIYAVENPEIKGVYELGGPEILSFRELMLKMLKVIRRRRLVIDLPLPIARLNASALDILQFISGGFFTNGLITRDQILQLKKDNVVDVNAMSFSDMGIQPVALDTILESYLYRFRPFGQYTAINESNSMYQDYREEN